MQLSLSQNPLAFPNRAPGWYPRHIVNSGFTLASGRLRFLSVIAGPGGGLINVLTPSSLPTVLGAPTSVIDAQIGYAVKFSTTAGVFNTFNMNLSTLSPSSMTFAAILRVNTTPPATDCVLCGTGTALQGFGIELRSAAPAGIALFIGASGGVASAGISLTTNHTYFVAISVKSGTQNWMALDLASGVVQLTTTTTTYSGVADQLIWSFGGGNTPGQGSGTDIAAGLIAENCFLSTQQLQIWSLDPWSFWYPRDNDDVLSLDLVGSSIITAALLAKAYAQARLNFGPFAGKTSLLGKSEIEVFVKSASTVKTSVLGQSILSARLRVLPTILANINAVAKASTIARASSSNSVRLLSLANSAPAKARAAATAVVTLFGQLVSQVQGRLAQPTRSVALLTRAATMFQARFTQPTGSVSLLTRAATMFQARFTQPTGSVSLLTRAATMIQARFTQPTGVTSLFARATVQTYVRETLTATAQQTAALLGRTLTMFVARSTSSGSTALSGRAKGPALQARTNATIVATLLGRTVVAARMTSQAAVSAALKALARTSTQLRLTAPSATTGLLGRIATLVRANAISTGIVALLGRATVEVGPQVIQPNNVINFSYLYGRATAAIEALPRITAVAPFTQALTGVAKAMVAARSAAPTGKLSLLGRVFTRVIALPSSTAQTSIVGRTIAQVKSTLTIVGQASILGQIVVQIKTIPTTTVKSLLFGRAISQIKASPTLTTQAPLTAALNSVAKVIVTARSTSVTLTTALFTRTIAQIKVLSTVTAQAPLTTALNGVARAMVTVRSVPAALATSLLARASAQIRARISPPGTQALFASATTMFMARFRQPSGSLSLAGRMTLTTRSTPGITVTRSLLARSIATFHAAEILTRNALLSTLANVITQARSQSTVKTSLLGRTAGIARSQTILTAGIALLGRARGPATQARLSQASRTIFLATNAAITIAARLTPPISTVKLFGRATATVTQFGNMFAVGRLQAIKGRIKIQTSARAKSLGLRSLVRLVSTVVSRVLPFSTAVATTYTAKTTITAFTSTTVVD